MHPGAIKAREHRARRAALRRGAVRVELLVEPDELEDLRRLGLFAGRPRRGRPPPEPEAIAAALRRLLAAAGPLAELAGALAPEDATGGG